MKVLKNNIASFSTDTSIQIYLKKFYEGLFDQEIKIFKKYIPTKTKWKILDLGCGTGRTTKYLIYYGHEVIGVDISKEMIATAKSLIPDVDFAVGDACNLPFRSNLFDCVIFSFNGIDYIYPENLRIKALLEINRVLKNNGLFIFSSHNSFQLISNSIKGYLKIVIRWLRNPLSKYKIDKTSYGNLTTYFINPFSQEKQLRKCGFKLIEIVGKYSNVLKYFEPWIYYVARKI